MLLVDKYAPKSLDDMLGNSQIVQILKNIESNFPHLLFYGPPGTGKTTVSHILMKNFDVLELNASDERGIDVIRNKIKSFCNKVIYSEYGHERSRVDSGNSTKENQAIKNLIHPKNTVSLAGSKVEDNSNDSSQNKIIGKLIILDECDNLTSAAQQALRRIMETSDTKFILICNEISKVIEPIQSRCAVLSFQRITGNEFIKSIKAICKMENIRMDESAYEALVDLTNGDIRSCLNCLQGVSQLNEIIDDDFLYQINGRPNKKKLSEIYTQLKKKHIDQVIEEFEDVFVKKYESSDLISGFFNIAKDNDSYDAMRIIGEYQLRASEGKTSKLQFYSMFSELMEVM